MAATSEDPYDLNRFVAAQAPVYEEALAELRAGHKETHWSWFVLPQVAGLGYSPMAVRYAIGSLGEARAYLDHPVLGARLRECVSAIGRHEGCSAAQILGDTDAMKFRSCLTLFAEASGQEAVFTDALAMFYRGKPDPRTLDFLGLHDRS